MTNFDQSEICKFDYKKEYELEKAIREFEERTHEEYEQELLRIINKKDKQMWMFKMATSIFAGLSIGLLILLLTH